MVTGETENVIDINELTRRFGALDGGGGGKRPALDTVSLAVPRGGVFGLVGENGAGKTTLIRHALGLFKAQRGQVRVFGLDPARWPERVLARVGYLSEDRDLPDWMRVGELMNYTRAFYPGWDDAYAEQLRRTFDLEPGERVKSLSRGQRAKAGLLAALAHRPELLVLDEPSSGLDPVVRRDILGAIIRTVADEGRTVLFSSHLLEEVERVADRVAMLHAGRLVLSAPLDDIKASHRRLVLRFVDVRPAAPALPAALAVEGEGRDWTVLCDGRLEEVRAAAASLGGEVVSEYVPTLEEIFVARARG
ncbi:MAG: ABC transporter ATP-binding protein [bacterium]|nr:ABC transporter ATP-binding protein [bacterium]